MSSFQFTCHGEQDTDRLGAALMKWVPDRTVIALNGTLGAGKTRLVKGMANALGLDPQDVISPTFVLMRQYESGRTLIHLDVYRIRDDDEFLELGPDEFFNAPAITLIEWADRVVDCLPRDRVEIQVEVTGENDRVFTIVSPTTAYDALLGQLEAELSGDA
ncbi:MAG: tRNA (adenosine(37)-N6)-threonylcarbamoyltransferase complex ATPase subunit type 1 TsaE [Pirellulaceae bacterium]